MAVTHGPAVRSRRKSRQGFDKVVMDHHICIFQYIGQWVLIVRFMSLSQIQLLRTIAGLGGVLSPPCEGAAAGEGRNSFYP
jgi:hypothetical protein